ncbi:hypothetical protein [Sinomonas sp. R1AF57]|uniref:hypothetical protein n=1 Tax=Sinomonas sp. R1AF57 TaxID=2020377 RepID=UPI000B5F97EC|nr:hypothetical protein [Sinomonas sp. R1AF57]ASN52500.1 hypothetical protein CGQ25_10785 [Sinomonas sp. R1AF57]
MTATPLDFAVPTADLTAAAYSHVPGYDAASRDVAIAVEWMRALRETPPPAPLDPQAELRAAASAGQPFPLDLPRRVREGEHAGYDLAQSLQMAGQFLADAKARQAAALEHGADAGLGWLRPHLDETVAAVRERATALRVLNADSALHDPAAAQLLRDADALTARYSAIRAVQRALVRAACTSRGTDHGQRMYLVAGQVADFIDRERAWLDRRVAQGRWPHDLGRLSKEQHALRGWLTRPGEPVLDALTWLAPLPSGSVADQARALALIVSRATPWLPSIEQLTTAYEQANFTTEGNALSPRDAEAGIRWLHRLEDVTGYLSAGAPPLPPERAQGRPAFRHTVPFVNR